MMRRSTAVIVLVGLGLAACSDDESPGGEGGASVSSSSSSSSASSGGAGMLPPLFTVIGTVVDGDGAPVEGASVLQGGKSELPPPVVTGADGAFEIELEYPGEGIPAVVAAKTGYRTTGAEFVFSPPEAPVQLTLYAVKPPDNESYVYGDPGKGDDPSTLFCGHCHNTFAKDFQTSKHAQATKDPLVQDLYAGTASGFASDASCLAAGGSWRTGLVPGTLSDSAEKCYVGAGVLADLNPACAGGALSCDDPALATNLAPTAFGACADCHAPGIDGKAGGRSLHEAAGIAYENGVHCDPCHKTSDIDLDQPPGVGQRLVTQRPWETVDGSPTGKIREVYFGPLIDVPNANMGGAGYQPKFATPLVCAGCHEQEQPALVPGASLDPDRWPEGLPTHSTYSEWLAGPYNDPATPCQFCHMPPVFELQSTADLATDETSSITYGFPRPPEQMRRHIFRSPLEGAPRLIDGAAYVSIDLTAAAGTLSASVSVANVGCGHALPTGEPMRAVLLLLSAEGAGCGALAPASGMTLNDVGGARAVGVEGAGVTSAGATVTWPAAAAIATPGQIVRVVRPSGVYDDYTGIGFFADPSLLPEDKGLEIQTPVGSATIASVAGSDLVLAQAIAVQAGDVLYLGDALAAPTADGQASLALAGMAGYAFARVAVDSAGARQAPHYRAIDLASDNRIAPGDNALTSHGFAFDAACTSATVTAWLVYRPVPLALGEQRGWAPTDYLIAAAEATIALP